MKKINLLETKKYDFISKNFLYILKNSRAVMNDVYILEESDLKKYKLLDNLIFESDRLYVKIKKELFRIVILDKLMYYFYKNDLFIINLNMKIDSDKIRIKFKRKLLEIDLKPKNIKTDDSDITRILMEIYGRR